MTKLAVTYIWCRRHIGPLTFRLETVFFFWQESLAKHVVQMLFSCEGMEVMVYAFTNHCQIYFTAINLILEGIVGLFIHLYSFNHPRQVLGNSLQSFHNCFPHKVAPWLFCLLLKPVKLYPLNFSSWHCRFICVISLPVGMCGLGLLTLVLFPTVTYVRMHPVCLLLMYPPSFHVLWFAFFIKMSLILPLPFLYVAFFYCEIDGSSLCLQCDMIVHVGGKRTHGRYLVLRQRVEVCDCVSCSRFSCGVACSCAMPPVIWINPWRRCVVSRR